MPILRQLDLSARVLKKDDMFEATLAVANPFCQHDPSHNVSDTDTLLHLVPRLKGILIRGHFKNPRAGKKSATCPCCGKPKETVPFHGKFKRDWVVSPTFGKMADLAEMAEGDREFEDLLPWAFFTMDFETGAVSCARPDKELLDKIFGKAQAALGESR